MKKDCVPIISCNPKYLGLGMPEWAINLLIFSALLSIFGFKGGWPFMLGQIFLNYVYVKYISKLEENIGEVLMNNRKIPSVIWGYFNSLPQRVITDDNSESASAVRD